MYDEDKLARYQITFLIKFFIRQYVTRTFILVKILSKFIFNSSINREATYN